MVTGGYSCDNQQIPGKLLADTDVITSRYPGRVSSKWTLEVSLCAPSVLRVVSPSLGRCRRGSRLLTLIAAAAAMLPSSVAKRKYPHPPPPASCLDSSPKRTRTSTSDHLAELLELESQVHDLGAKVFAFRHKGLPFFARLSQERVQRNVEGATDTAPTESKNANEDLRQVLKERLAVANSTLPTLLEELVMWNTKIQQAVDVKWKNQRLPFLDDEENGN